MTYKYSVFKLRVWELVWFSCIFLIGCIGNITVLIVIRKSKKISRKAPFNVYVFALALVDLFVSVFALPDYVLRTNIYEPPSGKKGTLMCKFLIGGFLPFWFLEVSVYLLVAICLERRKAIIDPFSTLQPQFLFKSVLVIVFLFFLSAFNQIPTLYGIYYNKANSTSGNFCTYRNEPVSSLVFHFMSFSFQCVIPLLIFVISFYQICSRLKTVEKVLQTSLAGYSRSPNYKTSNKPMIKKKTTIATMQIVVFVFFVCITPNEIVYMLFQFVSNPELAMNSPIFQITVMLRYANSCLNPLLYSYRSKEFRSHFSKVFRPCLGELRCDKESIKMTKRNSKSYSLLV